MQKMLITLIILSFGVSIHANNDVVLRQKGDPVQFGLPLFRDPGVRTESYELYMQDLYGDGWDGSTLDLNLNGVSIAAGLTVDSDINSFLFDADDYDYVTTNFAINTSWASEIQYGIYNSDGYLIYDGYGNGAIMNIGVNPALTLDWTIDTSENNVFHNAGFEAGTETWGFYPDYDYAIATTGEGIYNSEALFTAYAGEKAFKMWASWTGMENNIFKVFEGADAAAIAGQTFELSANMMTHVDDQLGEGTHAKLVAKYFGPGIINDDGTQGPWWENFLFMDESEYLLGSNTTANEWTEYSVTTTVPADAFHIEMGFTVKKDADGGGSAYVDNLIADRLHVALPGEPNLVLSGVLDLDLPSAGSTGKAVIVQAMNDIEDLSWYGIGVANNGGGTDGQEYTFPDIPLDSGTVVWIVRDAAAYAAYFGDSFPVNSYLEASSDISQNGDDAIELFHNGVVTDLFGDLNTDGTGEAWDYVDSWAFRNCDARTASATFDITSWTLGGANCSDDTENNNPYDVDTNPLGTTCPFPAAETCEAVIVCDLTPVTLNIVDSYGDTWNGNVLTVGDLTFTLDGVQDNGVSASFDLCLADAYYPITCGGGSYMTEVSWEMLADDGTVLLSGGAPYEGGLQVGETADILGCMDPEALNFDATATLDDGSCYYTGYDCASPLAAVAGANTAPSAPAWYTFTASLTGTATISSVGGGVDTQVYGYTGTCDALVEVGFGDDEGGSPEWSSIMVLDVVAGESYYVHWTDFWSPEGFAWTMEEALYPVTPQNLTAEAGMDNVYLAWEAAVTPALSLNEMNNQREARAQYAADKKAALHPEDQEVHLNQYRVNPDYIAETGSRTNTVVINAGGGAWDSEISWTMTDAAGTEVAAGGSPIENLELVLVDGTYSLNAFDAYGDGWNGTFLSATNETQVFLFYTMSEGSEGVAEFEVNDGAANLSLSDLSYDNDTDVMSVTVNNTGALWAYGGDIGFFLGSSASGDCQDPNSVFQSVPQPLAPNGSYTFDLGGIAPFLGYGVHSTGAMIDWDCAVPETDETDNIINAEITIIDPLEGVTYTVYREDAAGAFTALATDLEGEMYNDATAMGGIEYCYHVTQTEAEVESGASNIACATPYGPDTFPAPTDLAGSAMGYDVMLEWVAPDLSGFQPPMTNSRYAPTTGKPLYHTSSNTEDSTPPAVRQGGDTFGTATAITALPYTDNGSTVGLVADYGPYSDLSNIVCTYDGYYAEASTGAGADAVYSIDVAEETNVLISLCGSGYDTGLGVFNSDGVLVAANDDFCALQSEITCTMPAGMYYIVVSGWGTSEGDYVINVDALNPVSPVAGYNVYRDDEMVGYVEGVDETSFSDFAYNPEMPEGDTYTYAVSAYYDVQDVSSVNSNPVDVTTTAPPFECVAPSNLVAESEGNSVMLNWDAPEGGPAWFSHFDGAVVSGIGSATGLFVAEAAVKFGPETTLDLMGLSLTKVAFMSPDVTALFKVMIYDPVSMIAVDSTEVIDPTTLMGNGVWNEIDLPNPVAINGSSLMFGYKVSVTAEATYPMSIDIGPANNGLGNLIQGFGTPFGSMLDLYGLDGNFAIAGYADYGQGRSIVALDPPVYDNNNINTGDLESRQLASIVETSLPMESQNRALLGFHVYRNDTTIAMVTPGETSYDDNDAPWGTVNYYVTAEYNDTEECGESAPSNTVTLELANTPPPAVALVAPADGSVITVTEDNMDATTAFIWSGVSDADNDMISYYMNALTVLDEDTLDIWAPQNSLANGSFEENHAADGNDWQVLPDHWLGYPSMDAMTVAMTGETIVYTNQVFEAYDGDYALRFWGLGTGENTENNVFQEWSTDMLPVGTEFNVSAELMSLSEQYIGNGNSHVVLFAKYFGEGYSWIGMETSAPFNTETSSADEWYTWDVDCVVPEGAAIVQVGAMFFQPTPEDLGSVFIDDFYMEIPLTETGVFLPNSLVAAPAMEAMVDQMTWTWDVWSFDGYDETPSGGARTFTVNISELLALDNVALPNEFALHNNYPNPFNPVTNILYDIPEVTDVKLEIFNVMGQRVRTLAEGSHEAGRYQIVWNATNDYGESLSSGMYIYRIQAGDFVSVKKLILMK